MKSRIDLTTQGPTSHWTALRLSVIVRYFSPTNLFHDIILPAAISETCDERHSFLSYENKAYQQLSRHPIGNCENSQIDSGSYNRAARKMDRCIFTQISKAGKLDLE